MVLDRHSVAPVCERLGLSSVNLLYNWKRKLVKQGGATAIGLEGRVRELEAELLRVERERDILKKALSIFGREE
jgi:transposase